MIDMEKVRTKYIDKNNIILIGEYHFRGENLLVEMKMTRSLLELLLERLDNKGQDKDGEL